MLANGHAAQPRGYMGRGGLCDAVLVEGIEDPPRHRGGYKSGTICAEMT